MQNNGSEEILIRCTGHKYRQIVHRQWSTDYTIQHLFNHNHHLNIHQQAVISYNNHQSERIHNNNFHMYMTRYKYSRKNN